MIYQTSFDAATSGCIADDNGDWIDGDGGGGGVVSTDLNEIK